MKYYLASLLILLGVQSVHAENEAALKARFQNPPASHRILPIVHSLPATPEKQDGQRAGLRAKGFGGVTCNISFQDYLQDEAAWASFLRGVREAKKDGMALWLYDERGYPSGNAGGLTMRDHPEWEARGIFAAVASTSGAPVALTIPAGRVLRASAFPVKNGAIDLGQAVDLSGSVGEERLNWQPTAGEWRVLVLTEGQLYENTHAAVSLADKLPYVNLLMPEPTARFIELTHAEYTRRLDSDLGAWFEATFTDEPSLMSLFMRPQPFHVIPWAPNVAPEFLKRRGYDLEPLVPLLFLEGGSQAARTRYDFWKTVGELVSENFFGQIQTFCRAHNIPSGGHLLMEESFLAHVPLYGNFFQCLRRLDAPSMDCLTSLPNDVPWQVARMIGSVADLEGRTLTMSETSDHSQCYRPAGDTRPPITVSEDQVRGTCFKQMAYGINTITSYYRFAGLDDAALNRLNLAVGRASVLLRGGHQTNGIAMLYPAESAWVHFTPATRWTEDSPKDARKIDGAFWDATQQLFRANRDFTYVDAQALQEAKVQGGSLLLRDLAWRVLVLPRTDTLPLATWRNLFDFWESGGAVIALGMLPANSETEFPSAAVQDMARAMFGASGEFRFNGNGGAGIYLASGSELLLQAVVDSLLGRDAQVEGAGEKVHVTRRGIDGHEVFFVLNDSPDPWQGGLSFAGNGKGEQWNLETGEVTPCERKAALELKPYAASVFRFEEAPMPQRLPLSQGESPQIRYEAFPPVTPTCGNGEFLPGELTPEPGGNAWRASGTVSKDREDVFFFACFDFPQPVDVHSALALSAEVWRPEGQRCSVSVIFIVSDTNGAEFIVDTHQSMRDPGWTRCSAPLNAFNGTPWGKQDTGPCDWSAIKSVRIGWGGYRTQAGETVTFVTKPPEMVGLSRRVAEVAR